MRVFRITASMGIFPKVLLVYGTSFVCRLPITEKVSVNSCFTLDFLVGWQIPKRITYFQKTGDLNKEVLSGLSLRWGNTWCSEDTQTLTGCTSCCKSFFKQSNIHRFHHKLLELCSYTFYTKLLHVSSIYRGHFQGVRSLVDAYRLYGKLTKAVGRLYIYI
jgi:hypothetical protein